MGEPSFQYPFAFGALLVGVNDPQFLRVVIKLDGIGDVLGFKSVSL